jgi:hypothetical protein
MMRTYHECADPVCSRPTTSVTGLCWYCRKDSVSVHYFQIPDGAAYGGPGGTTPDWEPRGIVKRWIDEGRGGRTLKPEILAAFGPQG